MKVIKKNKNVSLQLGNYIFPTHHSIPLYPFQSFVDYILIKIHSFPIKVREREKFVNRNGKIIKIITIENEYIDFRFGKYDYFLEVQEYAPSHITMKTEMGLIKTDFQNLPLTLKWLLRKSGLLKSYQQLYLKFGDISKTIIPELSKNYFRKEEPHWGHIMGWGYEARKLFEALLQYVLLVSELEIEMLPLSATSKKLIREAIKDYKIQPAKT